MNVRLAVVAILGLVLFVPSVGEGRLAPMRIVDVIHGIELGAKHDISEWTGKRLSLADVDRDGDLDLIAHNHNERAYVVDVSSGRALVEVRSRYPYGPDLGPFNGARAADLDGDGNLELVVANRAAVVSVWTLTPKDGRIETKLRWDRHLNDHHGEPTADSAPVLGDLDADGKLDIAIQTEERGTFALRWDGTLLWSLAEWGGNAEPVIRDVDGDGDLDVVVFTDGGLVYAVEGATGEELWRFDARRGGVWPASIPAPGFVDDIDNDGRTEVVFCVRNVENATTDYAPGAPTYRQHHFILFMIREDRLLWKAKPSWGNPLCSAYTVAHDVDGDGKKEIFGMDWNTIGHKPGNWERLGPAHAFSFTHDGRERWHVSLDAWDAKPPFAMADADGDGDQDVLAYDRGGLVALDARTGAVEARLSLRGLHLRQGPLVADLGDGGWHAVLAVTGASEALVDVEIPPQKRPPAWPGWEEPARPARLAPPRPTPTPAPSTPTPAASPPPPATVSLPASPTPAASPSPAPPTPEPSPADPPIETGARIPAAIAAALGALAAAALVARHRARR